MRKQPVVNVQPPAHAGDAVGPWPGRRGDERAREADEADHADEQPPAASTTNRPMKGGRGERHRREGGGCAPDAIGAQRRPWHDAARRHRDQSGQRRSRDGRGQVLGPSPQAPQVGESPTEPREDPFAKTVATSATSIRSSAPELLSSPPTSRAWQLDGGEREPVLDEHDAEHLMGARVATVTEPKAISASTPRPALRDQPDHRHEPVSASANRPQPTATRRDSDDRPPLARPRDDEQQDGGELIARPPLPRALSGWPRVGRCGEQQACVVEADPTAAARRRRRARAQRAPR
jgi:hypothetical protein